MTEPVIIGLLLLYIITREVFFLYSTHKLINKIMSHNFHDYQQSLTSAKAVPAQPTPQPEDEPEDLGVLDGFGIQ